MITIIFRTQITIIVSHYKFYAQLAIDVLFIKTYSSIYHVPLDLHVCWQSACSIVEPEGKYSPDDIINKRYDLAFYYSLVSYCIWWVLHVLCGTKLVSNKMPSHTFCWRHQMDYIPIYIYFNKITTLSFVRFLKSETHFKLFDAPVQLTLKFVFCWL